MKLFSILLSLFIFSDFLFATYSCSVKMDTFILKGTCKGTFKHGEFIGLYPNGNRAWIVNYYHDELHGEFINYHSNGTIHMSGNYESGKLNGDFIKYLDNGYTLNATFKLGVLDGWLSVTNKNGKKIEEMKFYFGKLVSRNYF